MHCMRHRGLMLALSCLALALAACGDDDAADGFDAEARSGTYVGTWTNESSGTSGPVTISIDADSDAGTASLTIDFGGNYLGLGDPPPTTLTGTVSDAGAVVRGADPLFGDYDVTIAPDGAIVGVMKNLGGGAIPELTYTGTVTEDRLDADYVVTFADGTQATSILRMTKES